MMQDWNKYRDSLISNINNFASHTPKTLEAISAIGESAKETGHLEPKVHELIALAVAVTTRCDGCISVHTQLAAEHGATIEEISEALSVAISLNAGAALTYSARVMEAYSQLSNT